MNITCNLNSFSRFVLRRMTFQKTQSVKIQATCSFVSCQTVENMRNGVHIKSIICPLNLASHFGRCAIDISVASNFHLPTHSKGRRVSNRETKGIQFPTMLLLWIQCKRLLVYSHWFNDLRVFWRFPDEAEEERMWKCIRSVHQPVDGTRKFKLKYIFA